jgi:hypothetical protein
MTKDITGLKFTRYGKELTVLSVVRRKTTRIPAISGKVDVVNQWHVQTEDGIRVVDDKDFEAPVD